MKNYHDTEAGTMRAAESARRERESLERERAKDDYINSQYDKAQAEQRARNFADARARKEAAQKAKEQAKNEALRAKAQAKQDAIEKQDRKALQKKQAEVRDLEKS